MNTEMAPQRCRTRHTARTLVSPVLGIALLVSPAVAEFGGPMPVLTVEQHEDGCAVIYVPPGNFNPDGKLVVDPSRTARKELLALALAAVISGKSAWIGRNPLPPDSPCWWFGTSDRLDSIRIVR